jgi:GT2 family glycosyltransferase
MVTIIIVNYHLSREILDCLDSLERHVPPDRLAVVVVDNASSDEDLELLRQRVERCQGWQFVGLEENIGFGAACNRGASEAGGDWLCFLNPDTTVESDFLACLVDTARTTGASVVGPGYGPAGIMEWNCGVYPGPLLESLSIGLLGRPLEALWMGLRRRLGRDRPMTVDWVLGACMLLPRQRFLDSGGFDETFFLYFEEMDLCRRISDGGGRVVFAPACRIRHTGGVSGKRDYRQFTRRFYEGKLNYIGKHFHGTMRSVMRAIVWGQLQSQRILWRLPGLSGRPRATGKRAGIDDALETLAAG